MNNKITNLSASVNQRLLNLRDSRKEDFQIILNRFGLERFLYRISKSSFADRFILKGAFSFEPWGRQFYRPTRDADFLGFFEPSPEKIRRVFMEVCRQYVEPDGLIFTPDSVSVRPIREQNIFGGFRVRLTGYLGQIRIGLQFDVSIGKQMKPKPYRVKFPTILAFPAPRIFIYPMALTVAEKFHASCKLGMLNSRVKDHYDIYQISRNFSFSGTELKIGIKTIFDQEGSEIPPGIPDALSDAFGQILVKRTLWLQFLARIGNKAFPLDLGRVIEAIREFILPVARSAADKKRFDLYWPPGGPWRPREKNHDG